MATRQGIDTKVSVRLAETNHTLFLACEAQFDTETLRVWNGINDTTINGQTFTGASGLLTVSDIQDNTEMKSSSLTVSLNGMDATVLNLALTENYQNRLITLFLGYLDGGTDEVCGTMTIFKGRMTQMSIDDTPEGSRISVNAENRLVDLNRPNMLRYSKESQEFLHTGDDCFNQVNNIADKEIFWGRSTGGATGGGGRRNGDDGGNGTRHEMHK
tara:strand:+ start:669 stop:1313 length:645 start_codon:yes stop_codon:yes gene_type:complete